MKKRTIKKWASRFLRDRSFLPLGVRTEEFWSFNDGTPPYYITMARFPAPVEREINRRYRGCHWGNPLYLAVDDSEIMEYRERG